LRAILQPAAAAGVGAMGGNRDVGGVDQSAGDAQTKFRWDRQAVPLTSFV